MVLTRASLGLDAWQCFEKFDADQDGLISMEETAEAMRELNLYSVQDDIETMFKFLDKDGSGVKCKNGELLY